MTLITPIGPGRLTEDKLAEWSTAINALIGNGWTDYSGTFTLTASTTSPTKGNSTYAAYYKRANGGDLVHVRIYIVIGSTFSAGSGTYRFGLPVNASAAEVSGGIGSLYVFDNGTANRIGATYLGNAAWLEGVCDNVAGSLTHNNPQVWATGDFIKIKHVYEPA